MSKTGIGASVVFSGGLAGYSGFRVQNIGPIATFVENLDDTALDSEGFYENCPDDLVKVDPVELMVYHDAKLDPPLKTTGTITIIFPLGEGQSVPAKVVGSGFIQRIDRPQFSAGVRTMDTITVQFDGKTGPAFSKAT